MNTKDKLVTLLIDALKECFNIENESLIMIEIPKDKEHGDYSSNIALRLTKELKLPPQAIALKLKAYLEKNSIFNKIEVAGPGFLNFFLVNEEISSIIYKILNDGLNYCKVSKKRNEKIMVEYVSANPTGDLHLGHARGAAYGDSLTRILKFAGYDILREYYVNDAGNQIKVLGESLYQRYLEALDLPFDIEKIGYQGKDVSNIAKQIAKEIGTKYVNDESDEKELYFKKVGKDLELEKIKKDLLLYRVEFDHYQSELDLYKENKVSNVLNELKNSEYTYLKDGALWLKTTLFEDDKDRVLVKSDGTYTYLLPDIAYHKDKFDRGYDELLDILGADHHGYLARLRASMKILGYNPQKLNFKIIQMVRLIENGNEVKMSKRTGNAVTIKELCDDVGVDVARYFFISKPIESHLDFDLNIARKKSNDNPIYYIQYAYARICSILNKTNIQYEIKESYSLLKEEKEILLIKELGNLKEIIDSICASKEVNVLANYVYKASQLFHSFYNDLKVIDENNIELTKERLALIKATQYVLKICLNLLGIEAKESM